MVSEGTSPSTPLLLPASSVAPAVDSDPRNVVIFFPGPYSQAMGSVLDLTPLKRFFHSSRMLCLLLDVLIAKKNKKNKLNQTCKHWDLQMPSICSFEIIHIWAEASLYINMLVVTPYAWKFTP